MLFARYFLINMCANILCEKKESAMRGDQIVGDTGNGSDNPSALLC